MRPARVALVLAAAMLAAPGCASPRLGAAQLDALHSQRFDAPPEAVFSAASNALMDLGYHIDLTDADAGILRASRRQDPSIMEHTITFIVTAVASYGYGASFAQPDYFIMCVLVTADDVPDRAIARFETFENGILVEEEERIDALFTRIERRLLSMGEVPGAEPDETAPPDG